MFKNEISGEKEGKQPEKFSFHLEKWSFLSEGLFLAS